ncbi:MAG: hypothetical protein IJO21_06080 [Oscillospiraceae bacterium]|nr:hypothetical protein [Oscillospiraceae bacterium]MBQ7130588.1 hypothetical protein [Oscillospiraceae bacterium]
MSQKKIVKKRKRNKAYIAFYLYMLMVLMSLFSVASYTWFSLSQTPRVSDMNMYVTTQAGMELAATPRGEWGQQLDFRELVDETAPLRPITWSEQQQCFYAAGYGFDGRMLDIASWQKLNDERNANNTTLDGYYIKTTFYARSGQNVNVKFSPAVEVSEGIAGSGTYVMGKPEWGLLIHKNAGLGAEYAIRLGLRICWVDTNGDPYVDPNTGITAEPSDFLIYEPNCDIHADGSTGYRLTPSIDGTETLVSPENLILQSGSYWTECDPIVRGEVVHHLGDFLDTPKLFYLESGKIMKIDLYIWLEGQDVDCLNSIQKAQLIANIQFTGDTESQSGLTPIPVTP